MANETITLPSGVTIEMTPDVAAGGIVAQSGTAFLNLHQLNSWPSGVPLNYYINNLLQPSPILGYLYQDETKGFWASINSVQRGDGKFALCVDTTSNGGAIVEAAPTTCTAGVADAAGIAANANRRHLVVVNTSANWVSLSFNGAAVLYSGITLAPNGGAWEASQAQGNCPLTAMRTIASGAASVLAVQEGT